MLAAVLALAGLAWGQGAPDAGNPLAGHEVGAVMPDTVIAFTDTLVGVTYSGPVVVEVDGRPVLKITLEPASAPLPRKKWRAADWIVVGVIGAAAAGLGYLAGRAAH